MRCSPHKLENRLYCGKDASIQVRLLLAVSLVYFAALSSFAAPIPTNVPSNYPTWWFSRGVIAPTNPSNIAPAWPGDYPTSDDYAVINQGQLKNIATQAYAELQDHAPSSVWTTTPGQTLTSLITGWNPSTGDAYSAVNLGQMKTVAVAFYNVLIQIGYSINYPWTGVNSDDYAAANIGQAKNLFSFDVGLDADGNGLPDWWETKYLGHNGNAASSSPDGNGLTLSQDYQQGNDPTNYYSQGGTIVTPSITIVSGSNQLESSATFLSSPLVVKITNSVGTLLPNAPVRFAVTGTSGGGFASVVGGSVASNIVARTDPATGYAQTNYAGALTDGATSTINISSGSATAAITESTYPADGSVAAPTGVVATPGIGNGEIDLAWVNNAPNATYFIVLQSTDNVYWETVKIVNDPSAIQYPITGLDPSQSLYFAVVAGD